MFCEESGLGIEGVSVDSKVPASENASINIDIVIEKKMDALGLSSSLLSSSSKVPARFTLFDLVPRKLEWPHAVEGITNVIAS